MRSGLTQHDIEQGLRQLGLGSGDIVMLHSALSSFGHVEGGAETVVKAFLSVLGERGTLVVPTFGDLGVITKVVRGDPRAVQSIHPLASVAAIGASAKEICRDHWKAETAHAEGTPYLRIAERGGYVCLAGVDQDRNTALHTAEELLGLPYLTDRTLTFMTDEGEVTRTIRRFPGPHRDFIGLDRTLRERGIIRVGRIGNAVVRLMKCKELIDACLELGRADPAFALCDNANCADCVAQRAAIRRDRMRREAFTLVAASGLAGWTVPEMVESLAASGIDNVELDLVQGRPAHALPADRLRAVIAEFRDHDLNVASLRCSSVPEQAAELMDRMIKCDVRRMLLPLSDRTSIHAGLASERNVSLSVFNTHHASETVSRMLLELRDADAEVGFTFSPGHFVRAGEKPFLKSYGRKLRHFIDQLDLEDVCFDGTVQPLAHGNAEIKELTSILRCRSFDGAMVLTTENRQVGDLRGAAARFDAMLNTM